jgi:hypothetical protein
MRTFNPNDLNTYRLFHKEYEELEPLFRNIYGRCYNIAQIIDEDGLDVTWNTLKCYKGENECYCSK